VKRSAVVFLGTFAAFAQPMSAQGAAPIKPAFATKIATSDSLDLGELRLSPDGRWLLFSSAVRTGPAHLWVMRASGGAVRRLTESSHDEVAPAWFPSGRRIAFTSTHVGGVMTADFDPAEGRLVGTPKRASLEDGRWLDVSPDGKLIAYIDPRNRVRVIPANGGPARTILDPSGAGRPMLGFLRFSADGSEVYVTTATLDRGKVSELLRVPTAGGPPMVALRGPQAGTAWSIVADPSRDRVLTYTRQSTTILTLRGDTIAVMPPIRGYVGANWSPDGRALLKMTAAVNEVVRLVPTNGGRTLDATTGRGNAYPASWSADGKRLYSWANDSALTGGKAGLVITTVDGGDRRFVPLAPSDSTVAGRQYRSALVLGDGRFWALIERSQQPHFPLFIYDTQSQSARELTRNLVREVFGAGGYRTGGTELLFIERRGESYELHAVRGEGAPRVVHIFPRLGAPWTVAAHGERIAYGERVGDSTILYATRARGKELRVAAVAGDVTELAWSPDGQTLAAVVNPSRSSTGGAYNIVFLRITDQLASMAAPRVVQTGTAWDLAWLFDNRAVTVLEEQGAAGHTRVLRVPIDPGQQPTSLTPNEQGMFWNQYLSPDGRYFAIVVPRSGVTTLWSIDVDEAARAWRAKSGRQ
jgi:Tol biopolymer transport system component